MEHKNCLASKRYKQYESKPAWGVSRQRRSTNEGREIVLTKHGADISRAGRFVTALLLESTRDQGIQLCLFHPPSLIHVRWNYWQGQGGPRVDCLARLKVTHHYFIASHQCVHKQDQLLVISMGTNWTISQKATNQGGPQIQPFVSILKGTHWVIGALLMLLGRLIKWHLSEGQLD